MDPNEPSVRPVAGHPAGRDGARLREARSHLRRADPVLARLIDERPDFDPRGWMAELPAMDLYGALVFQVAGQQLSVASTRRILARIQALFGGHLPSAEELLRADPAEIRRAGPVRPEGRHATRPRGTDIRRPAEPRRAQRPAG